MTNRTVNRNVSMFPSDWDIAIKLSQLDGSSISAALRRIVREWQRAQEGNDWFTEENYQKWRRAQERAAAHTLVDTREGYDTESAKQEG